MRVIAICTDEPQFWNNRVLDKSFAMLFPGTQWVYELAKITSSHGISLMTGDQAIARIQTNELDASDVSVVQGDASTQGTSLIQLGAHAALLICFESPMYVGKFYSDLKVESKGFEHAILFAGALKDIDSLVHPHTAYFPSFDSSDLAIPIVWSSRKHLAFVVSNKYWKRVGSTPRALVGRLSVLWRGKNHAKAVPQTQLHDFRLRFISHFATRGLDLFGQGWENLSNLPHRYRKGVQPAADAAGEMEYATKKESLRHYKFVACIENDCFPGYVTEKIIDALVAGAIPLYLGAPDIEKFIPEETFIDLRNFTDLDQLGNYLESMQEDEALRFITAGQKFLNSPDGQRFTYQGVANYVFNLVNSDA